MTPLLLPRPARRDSHHSRYPRHPRPFLPFPRRTPSTLNLELGPGAPGWNFRHHRDAYTLVEMLIVVSIMIMLVAITLPVAKKVMDGSQGREASRQLNAYFAMAKARALQTGRPCGLFFPFPSPPLGVADPTGLTPAQITAYWPVRHATQVFLAEVPPLYSGSTTSSLATIADPAGLGGQRQFLPLQSDGTLDTAVELPILGSLINPGEVFLVRFSYKGEWYRCVRGIATSTTYSNPSILYYVGPNSTIPPGTSGSGKPFQIRRSPRPIGNALDLPRGTCIDITYSGVGNSNRGFPPPTSGLTSIASNLAVMLSPNGGIESMYINGFPTSEPPASLYFLIGKVEKVPTASDTASLISAAQFANLENSNLADPNSLWVIVSRGTGQVTTTENMPDATKISGTDIRPYIQAARTAAILGEQMGGK